ncbi:uncharacterized protein [Argopecten irradians]|uniref:uncharacterized protein n=1 Tax=Argopecten irradians TaxID=31199 RepID=UPI0037161E39
MLKRYNSFKTLLHTFSIKFNFNVFRDPGSIKIQPVGIENYEDVISIQKKVYGGIDKLPGLYRTMLRNHYAYSATLNGRHRIVELLDLVLEHIVELLDVVLERIVELLDLVLERIVELLDLVLERIVELLDLVLERIVELLDLVSKRIVELLDLVLERIVELLDHVLERIVELLDLVGYVSVMFVDDGETMIGKAVRVSDDQKGHRIGHQLQRYVEHQHKSDKRIKRLAYTSMIKGMTGKVETGTAELISIRNIMYFKGKQDSIQQIAPNQGQVHLLKKEELREIFRTSWETNRLFPDKRLMVDLVPYRLRESNVDILYDEHCHVLYSRADQSEGPKFCNSVDQSERPRLYSKIAQSEGPALLTVGYAYPTPTEYFCSIDIYGDLEEELFDKHVQQHAQECKGKGMDMVWFGCVYFKDHHDESIISRVMEKYGLGKDGSYLVHLVEETGRF